MTTKINFEDDNVFTHELTVEQARNIDEAISEDIEHVIDEAQGYVYQSKGSVAYAIIIVSR